MSEKRLGNISLVGIKFTEHLVSQRINDHFITIIDIGTSQYKFDQFALLIAYQMQLESDIPAHRALSFISNTFEYIHIELMLVVDYGNTCAVNKLIWEQMLPLPTYT